MTTFSAVQDGSTSNFVPNRPVLLSSSEDFKNPGFSWTFSKPVGSKAELSSSKVERPYFVPDIAGVYSASLYSPLGALLGTKSISLLPQSIAAVFSNGAPRSIVWKAGVASSASHVETWAEVEAFIASIQQPAPIVVYVDDSALEGDTYATIPSTASTNLFGQVWFVSAAARSSWGAIYILIENGGQIIDPAGFVGVGVYATPTAVSPVLITGVSSYFTLRQSWNYMDAGALVPIFSLTDSVSVPCELEVYFGAADEGDAPFFGIAPGKTATIFLRNGPNSVVVIPANLVSGAESSVLYFGYSAEMEFVAQPQFLGTLHKIRLSYASSLDPSADTTANRPAAPATGEMFFDTTLGYPIWWNGAAWVDATGQAP